MIWEVFRKDGFEGVFVLLRTGERKSACCYVHNPSLTLGIAELRKLLREELKKSLQ